MLNNYRFDICFLVAVLLLAAGLAVELLRAEREDTAISRHINGAAANYSEFYPAK